MINMCNIKTMKSEFHGFLSFEDDEELIPYLEFFCFQNIGKYKKCLNSRDSLNIAWPDIVSEVNTFEFHLMFAICRIFASLLFAFNYIRKRIKM